MNIEMFNKSIPVGLLDSQMQTDLIVITSEVRRSAHYGYPLLHELVENLSVILDTDVTDLSPKQLYELLHKYFIEYKKILEYTK